MNYKESYKAWLENPYFDEDTKKELQAIANDDNEIKERWESKNGVTFTEKADMDIDSFKKAVDGVDDWFVNELKSQGYEDGQDLVDLFTK